MIKFDKNEFLESMIYSTNDEYETRSRVSKEIVEDIEQLQQENETLKKQVEIKNSGFMASIEEVCEYATVLIEFEKWLDEEIKRIGKLIDPKKSIKPYGEELHLLETARNGYIYAKEKLQELKEGKKK